MIFFLRLVTLFSALTAPLFSSVIILTDGDILTGAVLKESSEVVHFQNKYGRLKVKKS